MEPLNTIPIQQFIQQVKAAEASRSREVKIDIDTARSLAYTMGATMSRLHGDLEKLVSENSGDSGDIEIRIDGSSWD